MQGCCTISGYQKSNLNDLGFVTFFTSLAKGRATEHVSTVYQTTSMNEEEKENFVLLVNHIRSLNPGPTAREARGKEAYHLSTIRRETRLVSPSIIIIQWRSRGRAVLTRQPRASGADDVEGHICIENSNGSSTSAFVANEKQKSQTKFTPSAPTRAGLLPQANLVSEISSSQALPIY